MSWHWACSFEKPVSQSKKMFNGNCEFISQLWFYICDFISYSEVIHTYVVVFYLVTFNQSFKWSSGETKTTLVRYAGFFGKPHHFIITASLHSDLPPSNQQPFERTKQCCKKEEHCSCSYWSCVVFKRNSQNCVYMPDECHGTETMWVKIHLYFDTIASADSVRDLFFFVSIICYTEMDFVTLTF